MNYVRFLSAVGLTLVFILLQNNAALAQWGRPCGGWHMMGSGYYGMGWVGMIMMVVFWGLVIAALVFFIRWVTQSSKAQSDTRPTGTSALDILMERYARGEIDRDEYEEKMAYLSR